MIVADTSTWIAFLTGGSGDDVALLDQALADKKTLMAPVVLAELLSDPTLLPQVAQRLIAVPTAEVEPGYWERVGALRAKVLAQKRKARLGDALIAQTCIDGGLALLTRDRDFRAFAEFAGLKLAI